MGTRYEDECCDCAVPAYPCSGKSCPLRNVPHPYCDECEEEDETLYAFNEGEYCKDCLLEKLLSAGIIQIVKD